LSAKTASPAKSGGAASLTESHENTMTKMTNRRIDIRSDRGQSMVEFALVVPILLMVVFAIIQFGMLYNNYITLTDATRVGARKGAVSRTAVNPIALTVAATRAAAPDLKPADFGVVATATAWAPGADITVEATYPYDINILGVVVASGTLRSKTVERVE
jgi:Flp pilus assembly protein TadG